MARRHAISGQTAVLSVRDLGVRFRRRRGVVTAVDSVSLEVHPGEIVGVIGESGSGKSMTALSVMGLLPKTAELSGSISLEGVELTTLPESAMREVRGNRIALIPQDALQSLNPTLRVGFQVGEPIELHRRETPGGVRGRVLDLMRAVGMARPVQTARAWPHQLSGGMQQRAMIATGLALEPRLIIADEPTTALDVTVQAGILQLLREIRDRSGAGMLFITHDLGVVAELCDYVYVMHQGRVVEDGQVEDVLTAPAEPYTRMLLASTPTLDVIMAEGVA